MSTTVTTKMALATRNLRTLILGRKSKTTKSKDALALDQLRLNEGLQAKEALAAKLLQQGLVLKV